MARIKPQALLIQSKKKKAPKRISATSIILCNLIVALIVLSLVATYRHWSRRFPAVSKVDTASKNSYSEPEVQDTSAASKDLKKYDLPGYAILNTSKGDITVELYKDGSPGLVDKFLDFCQKEYFKGMRFHHVIKHHVIEAGHSQATETAEDWTAKAKNQNQQSSSFKHEAFTVGTYTNKDSKEFELFITTAPIPDSNDKLLVFGRVIRGQNTVQEIEKVETDEHLRPKSPVEITYVTLQREI